MKATNLRELRTRHDECMLRRVYAGAPVLKFSCPLCSSNQLTAAPTDAKDQWDSLTTCTACGEVFFKIVTRYAVTVVSPDPEAKPS
jgi:transcription elongation factor Elf1